MTVRLPVMLAVGHDRSMTVRAATVGEAFKRIDAVEPGVRDHLVDEAGKIRPMVRIALRGEMLVNRGALGARLRNGDEIVILQSLAGG